MPTYSRVDIDFPYGEGIYLYDNNGKKYLDFLSGIAVTSLGHGDKDLKKALHDSVEKVWHTSNLFNIPGQEELGTKLVEKTFADLVFFTNSGTEAIECLIKVARKYQGKNNGKYRIITFEGAFHGRTMGALSATGKYLNGFEPALDGFDKVPMNDIEAVKNCVTDKSAAILIEPIQGEGGIVTVKNDFLKQLRELSDEKNLLLCFDEIQCGMGRTGELFAHHHWGVKPDIMAIAKGLGGGFPIGACLASSKVGSEMIPGTHGTTFGGNPLAMSAGNVVIDKITSDGFLGNVVKVSKFLDKSLCELQNKHDVKIKEIRGIGLMKGIQFFSNPNSLVKLLRDNNLLVVSAANNVIRLLPPLIVEKSNIEEAYKILDKTITNWSVDK